MIKCPACQGTGRVEIIIFDTASWLPLPKEIKEQECGQCRGIGWL